MNKKTNDFKIGLFVLVGIFLLLGAIFIFTASRLFERKSVEEAYFTNSVDGIQVGAAVMLRGVRVGDVTDINFSWNLYHVTEPRYVVVTFEVNSKVSLEPVGRNFDTLLQKEIDKGLRARVTSQGLVGAAIVSLEYLNPQEYPPARVPWKPRHLYIPTAPNPMSEMMAGLRKTLGNFKSVDFAAIGQSLHEDLANADKLITQLRQADLRDIGTNADALVTELRGIGTNANTLIANLRGVSSRLGNFVGTSNAEGRQVNLRDISSHVDNTLAQLQQTVQKLDHIVANLDVGSLNDTLDNVRQASQNLEETVREIKQYPAGAIFGGPPPPARSVEPSKPE